MVNLTATPGWGAGPTAAHATITLDVSNEPLGSVLAKINRKTRWQIQAPEKWLSRPVTQTLNKVALEEGLRSILNNAGIGNLLLMYDESFKWITVYDTEPAQRQTGAPSPASASAPPIAVSATSGPGAPLQSSVLNREPRPPRWAVKVRGEAHEGD